MSPHCAGAVVIHSGCSIQGQYDGYLPFISKLMLICQHLIKHVCISIMHIYLTMCMNNMYYIIQHLELFKVMQILLSITDNCFENIYPLQDGGIGYR